MYIIYIYVYQYIQGIYIYFSREPRLIHVLCEKSFKNQTFMISKDHKNL